MAKAILSKKLETKIKPVDPQKKDGYTKILQQLTNKTFLPMDPKDRRNYPHR